jgi:hypothetical protein
MITRTMVAALLLIGLGQAALAEYTTPTSTSMPSSQTNHENLPQELRQKLQQAGYKNVEIVPGSYLVNAQDAQGNNVMMRIGPTSMTVLTEASANSSATTGSGSNNTKTQSLSPGNANSSSNGSASDPNNPVGTK